MGVFLLLSCNKEEDGVIFGVFDYNTLDDGIPDGTKYFENPPYPVDADTLRILAIGNSFTTDAMSYMDALTKASGIDEGRLCLYTVIEGGASFETWAEKCNDGTPVNLSRITGVVPMATHGTLAQLLNQPWDVIVVQQVSNLSYIWSSYAILKNYIEFITSSCPNKEVCMA